MVGIVYRLHTGVLARECSVGVRVLMFPPAVPPATMPGLPRCHHVWG